MAIQLPELPYAQDALAPAISGNTMSFHYGKHHQAYVNKTNELTNGTELEGKSIEEIVKAAYAAKNQGLINQSAQVWNHTFFWNSMRPNGGGKPTGKVAEAIEKSFGGYDKFAEKFKASGAGNFASGWTWLAAKGDGSLEVVNTDDADTLLVRDVKPLVVIDVWEHAYYLDYQNLRPKFIEAWLDKLVNWDFANSNFG
ncbi:MAG: superoxide dismutase [Tistlia sp.]|uniref:superoxide dismutase n=1 Tax=Tistlia sp. TaxID=3057121 RepID=UPI0034A41E55